ncbi:hypothetical protein DDZ15_06160 [Rhodohalobacter mucosus]|uniref:Vitellogenin II n=2 Tax=Rhodohalobacter mucosus TaxID=2079485 RepID=A0A316U1K7_9BACT|nr:hypothetical protein DDZ15_06160 [Rhodohalobacter mucosus]
MFASSCYTQLETVDRRGYDGYYPATQRAAPERRAPVEERADEIENVEDYELGYEDGWVDAESFYFVDEETRDWYLEHGASLAHTKSHSYRSNYMRPYDPDWFYSPYHYYTYYGVPHWRHGFSIHFGWSRPWGYFGFGSHFAYNRYYYGGFYDYGYYRYPFYDPFYYGGYWSGWYGYYNRPVVIYNNNIVSNRNYSARSTGLASSRRSTINRTRPDINSSRSAVRANARSSRIDSRSAARSTVRSRGTSTRSSVGSRSTGRTTNRGTVNRSGSSSRGSSGSVGRTRSNNRSSGSSVNRSRSNNNRSSGSSVNRSRSSNRSSGSAVNRSRSSSRSSGSSASRSRSNNRQAAAVQSSSRSDVRSDVRSSIISGQGSSAIIRRGEIANRENTGRTIRTERSSGRSMESTSARESLLNRAVPGQRSSGIDIENLRPVNVPLRSATRLNREAARSGSSSFGRILLRGATQAASSVLREAAGSSRSSRSSSVGRSSSRSSSGSSAVRSSGSSSRSSGVSRSSGKSGSSRGTSSSRSRSSSRNN